MMPPRRRAESTRWRAGFGIGALALSLILASCSATGLAASATPTTTTDVAPTASLLCKAIGAFAGSSHYGEHVRRPDPTEATTLARTEDIAESALSLDRARPDNRLRLLAERLVGGLAMYRESFRSGSGIAPALATILAVASSLPARCLADRFVPAG